MDQAVSQGKKWYLRWYMWVIYFVILFIFISSANTASDKAQQVAQNAGTQNVESGAPQGKEKLELISYKCSSEYGYFKVTGQVKNISDKPMENVVAVGSHYTADGTFVKADEAIIKYNPILAGQTSPFETISTGNPEIEKCQIEFKEFFGGTISTKRTD